MLLFVMLQWPWQFRGLCIFKMIQFKQYYTLKLLRKNFMKLLQYSIRQLHLYLSLKALKRFHKFQKLEKKNKKSNKSLRNRIILLKNQKKSQKNHKKSNLKRYDNWITYISHIWTTRQEARIQTLKLLIKSSDKETKISLILQIKIGLFLSVCCLLNCVLKKAPADAYRRAWCCRWTHGCRCR